MTPFTPILRHAVERVPGALGAIFADWDGEAVESVTNGGSTTAKDDLALLAAHYVVILHHVQGLLHLTHFGEAEEIILLHQKVDLIVRAVDKDYFVVLVATAGAHLATALREASALASALRAEIA